MKMEKAFYLRTFLIIVTFLISAESITANAQDKHQEQWTPGEWAQVNVACLQAWICAPRDKMYLGSNQRIGHTPNDKTWGVCSTGSGPVDSCNHCLANPPEQPCEWWIEAVSD
ncbi:MAG: hypothetical protein ABW144_19820 [Candidatus Thiodiazotropha sp.]